MKITLIEERRRAQAAAARAAQREIEAAPPWYIQLFPFLGQWLPWMGYYCDLAIYQVERAIYYVQYLMAYTAWLIGRYRDAVSYHVQRFLFNLDDRLRRLAEDIEAEQQAPYLPPQVSREQTAAG